ncbi:FecR family protein [Dysgonomonas sp. Marseille-P4361]|uniref:FecR family protein n=1 Tax=Dysgonomonas sp. Marseille-P4361 TaxID=2161820 RepID=UPI000D54FE08|nr:FecR family protein [Dysgonomonas sp. Marseille-P4361]
MKYKNKVQTARQKYLEAIPLSKKEHSIIEADLKGKDFLYYTSNTEKPLILPKQYSAESTYLHIEARISRRSFKPHRTLVRYASSIAAIFIFAILSFYIYQSVSTPSLITISTSCGEQKEVTLPDGSMATLNSLSSIIYPKEMKGDIRSISLIGEAYFDVAKNLEKPFIVKVEDLDIKVLGTKFNITAYENEENIITSLFEGSVSVSIPNGPVHTLTPNDQSIYNKKEKTVQLRNSMNIINEILWKSGQLFFDNEPLDNIFKTLEREKQVTFQLENADIGTLRITANFDKDSSIENIISILAESGEFSYSVEGNVFIIKK